MKRLLPLLAIGVCLAACNKDEDIIDDDGGDGDITGARPVTASSTPRQSAVLEYTPAPGQFINETLTGGFTGDETTPAQACAYAKARLDAGKWVSLGAFGGYVVVTFDHSIVNRQGYDFAVAGNAFQDITGGSNEPGIVWVMQDANGNGLPDDTWYQLAGALTGTSGELTDYSVTYFRPEGSGQPVAWTDSEGRSGTVEYLPAMHKQPSYYPNWISASQYTLHGVRLNPQSVEDSSGFWSNEAYAWGYADNVGSDALTDPSLAGYIQVTGFDISRAVTPSGESVSLQYVDFVKVQTAVQANCGPLGEVSTEVCSFIDLSLSDRL